MRPGCLFSGSQPVWAAQLLAQQHRRLPWTQRDRAHKTQRRAFHRRWQGDRLRSRSWLEQVDDATLEGAFPKARTQAFARSAGFAEIHFPARPEALRILRAA